MILYCARLTRFDRDGSDRVPIRRREVRLIGTFAEGGDSESGHKGGNKAKRVRTTFTEEQLSVLQANFQLDSNPDGQDLERIAHVTGLSKRVTQVWFQNSRARQKKHLHTGKMKGQHGKLYRVLNTFLLSLPLLLALSSPLPLSKKLS